MSALYGSAITLARLASALAPASDGKLARTFRARRALLARWRSHAQAVRDVARPLLWLHAPSVGEGLQARPVLEALRRERPDIQIAYTFFSPSAVALARSLPADMADYLPFDSAGQARELVGIIAPTALLFVKLDVWPNLVMAARDHGSTTGLLSGTVAPRSGRQGLLAGLLLRDAYRALDVVGAIDEADGRRLIAMGVRPEVLSISGDTRFDQVWDRATRVDRQSALLQNLASPRPTLVAGSTWPADEAVLLPAWLALRDRMPSARLILVPHEPTPAHIEPLRSWARQHALAYVMLSELHTDRTLRGALGNVDVVVVDRTGVLGELYALAQVAFVGGAFHRAGLHSVLEPAAYGAPVLFGPRHDGSREAGLLLDKGGARVASSVSALTAVLSEWLADRDARELAGEAARQVVQRGLGAADRSLALALRAITMGGRRGPGAR